MSDTSGPVAETESADVACKSAGSSAVITDESGRVLLVRRNYSRHDWVLPGGGVDAGESVVDAGVREVREETGLEVVAQRLSGVYHEPDHPAGDFLHFVFVCETADSTAQLTPQPGEISDCGYFAPDDLPRPISDLTVRRIRDALAGGLALPVTVERSRLVE